MRESARCSSRTLSNIPRNHMQGTKRATTTSLCTSDVQAIQLVLVGPC